MSNPATIALDSANSSIIFNTTETISNTLTERMRINNVGAIGIAGANYGISGQVLISNGSGTSVSWANQTDTTYTRGTGINISTSNVISIGQEVGITDSPSFTQLTVGRVGTHQGILNLQDETTTGTTTIAQIRGLVSGNNGGQMRFLTKINEGSLTERLRITSAGRVGINTIDPGGLLEVKNSHTQYLRYGTTGNLSICDPDDTGAEVRLGTLGGRPGVYSTTRLELQCDAPDGIIFGNNNIEYMRLTGSTLGGNLGIGTQLPREKLEVNGKIRVNNAIVGTGTALELFTNTTSYDSHSFFEMRDATTSIGCPEFSILTNSNGSSVGSEAFRILSNGDVGIGTNSPNAKLDVDGDIKGDNLNLGANGQTPKIDMLFNDSVGVTVYDTRIEIGKSDDFINSPASVPANAYGMNVQANSDALFVGVETYDAGSNWRPLLKWGDDLTDTPFTIQWQSASGNHKWEFGTDGRLVVPNVIKGASGTVCKIHILPFTDAETIDIATTSYQDVVYKTFTKTAGTNMLAEVKINYTIVGSHSDTFEARLNFFNLLLVVGDNHSIVYNGQVGGGHRSGGINDAFVYSNGTGVDLSGTQYLSFQARKNVADDTITFKQGMFKVTEIWA